MHSAHHHVTQFGRSTHSDGKHVAVTTEAVLEAAQYHNVRMVNPKVKRKLKVYTVGGCREMEQRINKSHH